MQVVLHVSIFVNAKGMTAASLDFTHGNEVSCGTKVKFEMGGKSGCSPRSA